MGYSIDLLNSIRLEQDEDYQARIPMATKETLASIGQAFDTYQVEFNQLCDAIMNKFGMTIISQKLFDNKLSRFKSGGVVTPRDVEEMFIEMAKSEGSFDKDGKNPLGRRTPPDVKVIYHRENRQDVYAQSIGDIDFKKAFTSEERLDAFIAGIINSMYSGDEYDEWVCMKNLIGSYKNKEGACGYFDYEVKAMGDDKETFAKDMVKAVRKAVQDLSFASTKYNVAGVTTWSKPSELVLLINKDVLVEVDVERLATAFHDSKTDMKVVPTIISMDDFGQLTDTYGILVDKDWFRVYDTLMHMETQRNAQGLFTNYFLHHHQILSASTFKNAVRFKKVA